MIFMVEKDFIDKNTKELYKKGNIYITEDEDRVAELKEDGYLGLELIIKPEELKIDLNELNVTELKELAKEKEIEGYTGMKKEELIKALGD